MGRYFLALKKNSNFLPQEVPKAMFVPTNVVLEDNSYIIFLEQST